MTPRPIIACAATLVAASILALRGPLPAQTAATSAPRTWTSTDGRTMQASLTGVEGDTAVFRTAAGQAARVPLARLSPADQEFIRRSAAPGKSPTTAVPASDRTWPKEVSVPPKSIDVQLVEESAADKTFRYRSEAFEFISQDKLAGSVMNEVARVFEGTRALVTALPWGVKPAPPADLGFFQAKLYVSQSAYDRDVGMSNSGGVYSTGDRVFRVPFPSMGLVLRGKTWFKDDKFTSDTLVHEITHQMMHDYLGFLPLWIAEGCAEYTNMLPYNAGTFHAGSHEKGIKDYIRKQLPSANRSLADLGSPSAHMNMTPAEWATMFAGGHEAQHRIYGCSCLLVYYFCHLDGDGKGTRFLRYFDALAAEGAKWNDYEAQFARYRAAMDEFFKQPGVTKLENGRFSYPDSLTPPKPPEPPSVKDRSEFGRGQMELLFDGRSPSALDEEVRAGFKRIGVKW